MSLDEQCRKTVDTAKSVAKHQLVCPRVWLTVGVVAAPELTEQLLSSPVLSLPINAFLWLHENTIDQVSGLYANHISNLYHGAGLIGPWHEVATHVTADAIATYALLYSGSALWDRIKKYYRERGQPTIAANTHQDAA